MHSINFLHHSNINYLEHMEDHLHLNGKGLFVFVANIKFAMLGILMLHTEKGQ